LKTIISLIKKDFVLFWNDKVAFSLTFIVPAVLIYIFGSVFGGAGNSDIRGIRLALVNNSTAPIAAKLEKTLDTTKTFFIIKTFKDESGKIVKFDTNNVKDYVRKGSASAALVIPVDAYTDTSTVLKLRFFYDPKNEIETQVIQGMLQKTVMESMPDLFRRNIWKQSESALGKGTGGAFNKEIASIISKYYNVDTKQILNPDLNSTSDSGSNSNAGAAFFKNILNLEQEQLVGKEVKNPNITRSVGGWALMFLLFTLTAVGSSLFDEQKNGVILRILSAPVSTDQILWGKYLYGIILGIIQLVVLFFAGSLIFKIDVLSNFFNLFLVVIAGATACTAFGMLLAAFCTTSAQASGWGTFLILTMSSIGGAWFPTFLMPPFIQSISKLTIVFNLSTSFRLNIETMLRVKVYEVQYSCNLYFLFQYA